MGTKRLIPEKLSYFRLSLQTYLRDSHPDKASDQKFIAARGDLATETYSNAIKSGSDHIQAGEIANQILFGGLLFSPYHILLTVLRNEFSGEVRYDKAEKITLSLLPHLQAVFAKYVLSDNFAATPSYEQLYTELTGTVQILIEDGLQ